MPVLLCFFLYTTCLAQSVSPTADKVLSRWQLRNVLTDSTGLQAEQLLRVWDSLYPERKQILFNELSEEEWITMLVTQYRFALKAGHETLLFRLTFPLATMYHIKSEFRTGLPLFESLYQRKQELDEVRYPLVLIKLEEEYRSLNLMEKAFHIRSERVEQGFIHTYWELYKDCGLYREAIHDFLLFEPMPAETDVPRMKYFWRIGELYFLNKQYDSAAFYYNKGLATAREFNDQPGTRKEISDENAAFWPGLFNGLLGSCLVKEFKYQEALPWLFNDIASCKGRYRIHSWLYLSDCYLAAQKLDSCKEILDSLQIYLNGKSMKESALHYLQNRSAYYESLQQFDSAFYYQKQYQQANAAITQQLTANQAGFLLANMELQKRRGELDLTRKMLKSEQQQILLQKKGNILLGVLLIAVIVIAGLQFRNFRLSKKAALLADKHNQELQSYADRITAHAHANEVLLQELHHRVKNNLQLVQSLINMQSRRISQADTRQVLETMSGRIHSMSRIHEMLHNRSNQQEVDMQEYITSLTEHVQHSFTGLAGQVAQNIKVEPISISADKAGSVGLIINELIINAYKHAFLRHQSGRLDLLFRKQGLYCYLEIRDNGPGFLPQEHKKVTEGLGLRLVQALCQQLQAEHQYTSVNGVSHHFTFKY